MADGVILDNDVLIKASCYSISEELIDILSAFGGANVVGVTRYIVEKQIQRSSRVIDKISANSEFKKLLASLTDIEPTEAEILLAAELETHALEKNLHIDSGESQILAIALYRTAMMMVTGDKRAIGGIEPVLEAIGKSGLCDGRVVCLEQIIMSVLSRLSAEDLQKKVCREIHADKTLTLVFSCKSCSPVDENNAKDGLASYIRHVRASAPSALFPLDELSVAS